MVIPLQKSQQQLDRLLQQEEVERALRKPLKSMVAKQRLAQYNTLDLMDVIALNSQIVPEQEPIKVDL